MNRIGSFNPSLQGPNEPPYRISDCIEQYRLEIEEDEEGVSITEDKIDQREQYIIREAMGVVSLTNVKHRHLRNIAERKEWIAELEAELTNKTIQIESLKVEIELLEEDPGNEEKVIELKTKIEALSNRL